MATKLSSERILKAARAAVEANGYENLSLRAVARELGVTAPALYDHFGSRDELLRSIAAEGFLGLAEALETDHDRALDRVRSRALRFVTFAANNRELFRLMFLFRIASIDDGIDPRTMPNNELPGARELFARSVADIGAAVHAGDLAERDTNEIAMILWVTTQGVATVALNAPLLAASLAEDVIDTALRGLAPH